MDKVMISHNKTGGTPAGTRWFLRFQIVVCVLTNPRQRSGLLPEALKQMRQQTAEQ